MSDFKVGDTVRVTEEYVPGMKPIWAHAWDGKVGTLVTIDNDDENYPYQVRDESGICAWVYRIELVERAPATEPTPSPTQNISVPLTDLLGVLADVPGVTINHVVTILKANGVIFR